jgi:hypothetical protein
MRAPAAALQSAVLDAERRVAGGKAMEDHEVLLWLAHEQWWALAPGGRVSEFPTAAVVADRCGINLHRARRLMRSEHWADKLEHDAVRRERWNAERERRRTQTKHAAETNHHRRLVREWMAKRHPASRVNPEAVARLVGPHGLCRERIAAERSSRTMELALLYERRRQKPRKRLTMALEARLGRRTRSKGSRRDRKLQAAVAAVWGVYVEESGLEAVARPLPGWQVAERVQERLAAVRVATDVDDAYAFVSAEMAGVLRWVFRSQSRRARRLRADDLTGSHLFLADMYGENLVHALAQGYLRPSSAWQALPSAPAPEVGLALPDRPGLWMALSDDDATLLEVRESDGRLEWLMDAQRYPSLPESHWVPVDDEGAFHCWRQMPSTAGAWRASGSKRTLIVRRVEVDEQLVDLVDGSTVKLADLADCHWQIIAHPGQP